MNTKICTSIEQSKKLLSLGLDPSTADVYWSIMLDTPIPYIATKLECQMYKEGVRLIPAWSLTALLELMPVCINDDNYFLVIEKDATHLNEPIWRVSYKHFTGEDAIVEHKASLIIDAAFELLCWLIEQGHIKVNK